MAVLICKFREGTAPKDHSTLRALSALMASLPSSDSKYFREEFDTVIFARSGLSRAVSDLQQEYEDVQLTAYLSTLTKSANALNDVRPSSTQYSRIGHSILSF